MPITPAILAPQIILGAGSLDPIGIANWTLNSTVICTWCLGIIVNATGGTPLIAAGPVIVGTGALIAPPGPLLGPLLAVSSLSLDAPGITKWMNVAIELARWIGTGGIDPSTLIAFVGIPPGPVSGVAKLSIPGKADLATAAGATDVQGKAHWDAVATAIALHLNTLALVTPAMVNPGTGGPVTGTGSVS